MSHCELLPIPPVETATDPAHSAADMRQRWRALMGPLGFGERLLRFAFMGPDRDAAAAIRPTELRTLDAIHLAAAMSVPGLRALVTYDRRLADAAADAGVVVVSPS